MPQFPLKQFLDHVWEARLRGGLASPGFPTRPCRVLRCLWDPTHAGLAFSFFLYGRGLARQEAREGSLWSGASVGGCRVVRVASGAGEGRLLPVS